jgi:hypothetical protein
MRISDKQRRKLKKNCRGLATVTNGTLSDETLCDIAGGYNSSAGYYWLCENCAAALGLVW